MQETCFHQKHTEETSKKNFPFVMSCQGYKGTEGRFQSSAAELRRLIGTLYKREDICNGEQQDLEEFHTLLLDVIAIELRRVEGEWTRFGNKYQGNEQTIRKFWTQQMDVVSRVMCQEQKKKDLE